MQKGILKILVCPFLSLLSLVVFNGELSALSAKNVISGDFRMVVVGDILLHWKIQQQALRSGTASLWTNASQLLSSGDVTIGNLEGPIAPSALATQPYRKHVAPNFNFDVRTAGDLKNAGFDMLSVANNHTFDRRTAGARETHEVLSRARLTFSGSLDRDYDVFSNKGIKVGLVGCSMFYGGRDGITHCSSDKNKIRQAIDDLVNKENANVVVVMPHWGNEHQEDPSSAMRTLANEYFEMGADVVAGAHPHVLQRHEIKESVRDRLGRTKKRLVLYSLGNFVSNQVYSNFSTGQKSAAIAVIAFDKKSGGVVEFKDFKVAAYRMHTDDGTGKGRMGLRKVTSRTFINYFNSKFGSSRVHIP